MRYRVISTDDHMQEAPHAWLARMSAQQWGDKIPQVRHEADGNDGWYLYGTKVVGGGGMTGGLGTTHGAWADRTKVPRRMDEMPKIVYVPAERIKAMDQDGVDAHTFFPNVSGFAGNRLCDPLFPEDFRLQAIRAYNDYQIEEWSRPHPGRFITLAVLPLWDVGHAVAELHRTAKLGINGVSFCLPQGYGFRNFADPYWDPLWQAAQETDLSFNLHFGASGLAGVLSMPTWEGQSEMRTLAQASVRTMASNVTIMTLVLFSGVLERFPRLKIVSSESGLGWIPYVLEIADHQWDSQRLMQDGSKVKPSELFKRQCYANFWFEVFGPAVRHHIGLDNIMWESDFPHPTCTWPNSQSYIHRSMDSWPEAERHKVLVDNAVRLYHLDPR
ncbi:MAG: amidohydrolase [Dehalococcoidia bacterium]|nr:amidohydrolase [Dehalococcoidia bacterium]